MSGWLQLTKAASALPVKTYVVDRPLDEKGQYRLEFPREFPFGIKRMCCWPNDPVPPLTWHTYLEVFVLLSRCCRIQMGARQIQLAQGDVLVMDHLRLHAMRSIQGVPVDWVVIRFMPEFALGLAPSALDQLMLYPFYYDADTSPRIVRRRSAAAGPVHVALSELLRCWSQPVPAHHWRSGCRAYFMVLLHLLSRRLSAGADFTRSVARRRQLTGRLRDLFEHIEKSYASRLSVGEAASIAGLSKPRFHAVFREATGMTLLSYLNQLRLARAARLLKDTERSIADIASQAGFSDQSYFDRRFRRQYGLTPLRYRNSSDVPSPGGPPGKSG